jgi:hypothetical protein
MLTCPHYISGPPETAVNADTVLCKLNETTGRYQVLAIPSVRGSALYATVIYLDPARSFLSWGQWA